MEVRSFRDKLLKLLTEDDEVIEAVKRIHASEVTPFKSSENQESELLQQISELQEKLRSITQQKELIEHQLFEKEMEMEQKLLDAQKENEEKLKEKDADINLLQNKYMECKSSEKEAIKEKAKAIKECNDYKQKYSELDAVYKKYLELGAPIIQRMERILNQSSDITESPEIFMAYGTQENNIVALWDSIAANFEFYDSQGKTEDLIDIFQYFLSLYKEITYKDVQIDWPDIGKSYDERKHTRTSSSSVVGNIQKVILPGFIIGKSITKKALVIVK